MEQKYTMRVKTPDGYVEVEVSKEIYDFNEESQKEMWRIDKQIRDHQYSLDKIVYEGKEFGFYETYPCEEIEERLEEQKLVQKCRIAFKKLTQKQQNRFIVRVFEDYTYEQIAEQEGVDKKTVYESVQSAIKKIRKFCESTPTNT